MPGLRGSDGSQVGKRLCASPLENHWALRHHAAALVRLILARFKDKYDDLQPRVLPEAPPACQRLRRWAFDLPPMIGANNAPKRSFVADTWCFYQM